MHQPAEPPAVGVCCQAVKRLAAGPVCTLPATSPSHTRVQVDGLTMVLVLQAMMVGVSKHVG
jgi:hypothetical protein